MTSSTRFWKRHNKETDHRVDWGLSCSYEPLPLEPIQLRLRSLDDGPMSGTHFLMTMTAMEARTMIALLTRYAEKVEALNVKA